MIAAFRILAPNDIGDITDLLAGKAPYCGLNGVHHRITAVILPDIADEISTFVRRYRITLALAIAICFDRLGMRWSVCVMSGEAT